jgi:glutamyl-tRNA reductase
MTTATVSGRTGRRLVVVDLGVPRNVDPAVGRLSGVTLTHMDQLICHTRAGDPRVQAAEHIVAEELRRYGQWCRARAVAPQIMQLLQGARNWKPTANAQERRDLHRKLMALKAQVAA